MRVIVVHNTMRHQSMCKQMRRESSQSRQVVLFCDDGDDDAVAASAAAAAAFASLSTLSASLMCGVDGPGMLRKCVPSDDLRLGVVGEDQAAAGEVDWAYGDPSDIELLRDGMESGCK
jgi:hypothetical protein